MSEELDFIEFPSAADIIKKILERRRQKMDAYLRRIGKVRKYREVDKLLNDHLFTLSHIGSDKTLYYLGDKQSFLSFNVMQELLKNVKECNVSLKQGVMCIGVRF